MNLYPSGLSLINDDKAENGFTKKKKNPTLSILMKEITDLMIFLSPQTNKQKFTAISNREQGNKVRRKEDLS